MEWWWPVHRHRSRVQRDWPVNDRLEHVEVTTNGIRKVTDAEPPEPIDEAPRSLNGQSVDERLDALMETIRTWDWRAASVEAGPPPPAVAASTVSSLTTTASAEVREDSEPLTLGPPPPAVPASTVSPLTTTASAEVREDSEPLTLGPPPADVPASTVSPLTAEVREDSEPLTLGPPPVSPPPVFGPAPVQSAADTQPVMVEPMPGPATVDPSAPEVPEDASEDASSSSEPWPDHPIGRLWSHPRTKVVVLCLAAVVAVILIIWGIRLVSKGSGSGNPSTTATTATTATHHAASHVHQPAFVAPIDTANLTKYQQYAAGIDTANATATTAFVGAGSTPTLAQVTPVVTAYRTALNLYDFQLRFIQWPASMQPAITVEHAQLEALVSFLQSISTVTPTGVSPWLSQLHIRAATAQTADNQIRQDLGLPSTSSFP